MGANSAGRARRDRGDTDVACRHVSVAAGDAAGIDNLAFPLVFAPLIWAMLFFHACLDRNIARVALVAAALFLAHGGIVAYRFVAAAPAAALALGEAR